MTIFRSQLVDPGATNRDGPKKFRSPSNFRFGVLIALFVSAGDIHAQPEGVTRLATFTLPASSQPMMGWSVKGSFLGRSVYNDAGKQIGTIIDLLVTSDVDPYVLVIGVGGSLEIGGHAVAVPLGHVVDRKGLLSLPCATRDSLKEMPRLTYLKPTVWRARFISAASIQLATANAQLILRRKEASSKSGTTKVRLELDNTVLQEDIITAEDKLDALKKADTVSWMQLQQDVQDAVSKVQASISISAVEPAAEGASPKPMPEHAAPIR